MIGRGGTQFILVNCMATFSQNTQMKRLLIKNNQTCFGDVIFLSVWNLVKLYRIKMWFHKGDVETWRRCHSAELFSFIT